MQQQNIPMGPLLTDAHKPFKLSGLLPTRQLGAAMTGGFLAVRRRGLADCIYAVIQEESGT